MGRGHLALEQRQPAGEAQARVPTAQGWAAPTDLPIPVVDPKGDRGRVEQQQELVLEHLLLQALDGAALPLVGLLQGARAQSTPSAPCSPSSPCAANAVLTFYILRCSGISEGPG